jgi:hypothetical protein
MSIAGTSTDFVAQHFGISDFFCRHFLIPLALYLMW